MPSYEQVLPTEYLREMTTKFFKKLERIRLFSKELLERDSGSVEREIILNGEVSYDLSLLPDNRTAFGYNIHFFNQKTAAEKQRPYVRDLKEYYEKAVAILKECNHIYRMNDKSSQNKVEFLLDVKCLFHYSFLMSYQETENSLLI